MGAEIIAYLPFPAVVVIFMELLGHRKQLVLTLQVENSFVVSETMFSKFCMLSCLTVCLQQFCF